MSAHFDGGAEIAGRRLREVEVTFVDDPTLDMGAEDSDDCPASPPPTYYLRVREEKRSAGRASADSSHSDNSSRRSGGDSCDGQKDGGDEHGGQHDGPECESGNNGNSADDRNRLEINKTNSSNNNSNNNSSNSSSNNNNNNNNKKWSWRYVNVEKKCLLVWDRRGGRLLRSIPLRDVESLTVLPDQDAPASILEVYISRPAPLANANCSNNTPSKNSTGNTGGRDRDSGGDSSNGQEATPLANEQDGAQRQQGSSGEGLRDGDRVDGGVLVLQARSRRETLLWAKVLQENVELMTKRRVPLENRDEETSLSDVQQLAKLLTHQLSELQRSEGGGDGGNNQQAPQQRAPSCAASTSANGNGTIPEGVEGAETEPES